MSDARDPSSLSDMYRVIAEYTYDWETWVDQSGAPRWINSAVERMTGYSAEECLARSDYPLGLACPEDVSVLAAVLADAARGGSGNDVEFRVQRKDGNERWVAVSWQAVRAPDGGYLGYRTSVRDIEERKRMEAELHVMRRRAEAATIARSELLANVSHELRSPLHNIAGFADLLSETDLDPTQRRYVERIAGESAHMARQVADLLQFAALEAGGLPLAVRRFDLDELVRETLDGERSKAAARGLALRAERGFAHAWVEGDPVRVGQVLRNLLDNALKFTERGAVDVQARSERRGGEVEVELCVSDSGPGMSREEISLALLPFQQGTGGIARRHAGVGLGLSIVKRLVDTMRGALHIDSALGRGTAVRVTFTLPAAAPLPTADELALSSQAANSAASAREAARGIRALVVDDSAIARELLRALLEREGCVVTEACSGQQALAAAATQAFDVVLLDYQMPTMDGFETAVALRRLHAGKKRAGELAIYLLTANVLAYEQVATLSQTRHIVDGVLEKPLARATLAAVLAQRAAARRDAPSASSVQEPPAVHEPRAAHGLPAASDLLDARVVDDLRSFRSAAGELLLPRIIERTRSELATALARCRAALTEQAWSEAAAAAHEIAGHAALVGARQVAECARALERTAVRAVGAAPTPAEAADAAAEPHQPPRVRSRKGSSAARQLLAVESAWQRTEPALSALLLASVERT